MTRGTRPGRLPQPSRPGREQRTCSHPGCQTRLSIYNVGDRCWQHADVVFPNHRGKRLREDGG